MLSSSKAKAKSKASVAVVVSLALAFAKGFGRPISLGNTKLHAAREKMRYELDGSAYKSFSVSAFFLRAGAIVFRFFASRSLLISANRSCWYTLSW